MDRAIYACDVGSVRTGKFAWARVEPGAAGPVACADIDELVSNLLQDVNDGMSIALGFEAPMFMPVPEASTDLSRGREGDGNRAMFAPAGAAVATLGLHEAAWVLRALRHQAAGVLTYTLDWLAWPRKGTTRTLLLWEAFVSGAAHDVSHQRDAATAAVYFRDNENRLNEVNAVTADKPLCMLHTAALWAGWAQDLARLYQGCLVLKPGAAYGGPIEPA